VTLDIEKEQQLNTAIAAIMELVNALYSYPYFGDDVSKQAFESVVMLLAPFAPHITEEMWELLGNKDSIMTAAWPLAHEEYLNESTVELPVQINGKLRGIIQVQSDINETDLRKIVESEIRFKPYIGTNGINKFIYVPKKIINVIVR
jgi:leucyl-tRNA synthetase